MEEKGDLRIYNRSSANVKASMFCYFVVALLFLCGFVVSLRFRCFVVDSLFYAVAALFRLRCLIVALLFPFKASLLHWMGNGHTEMFFPCFFPVSLRVSSCCPWRPTSLKAWVWVWRERENLQSGIMLRCFRGWPVGRLRSCKIIERDPGF